MGSLSLLLLTRNRRMIVEDYAVVIQHASHTITKVNPSITKDNVKAVHFSQPLRAKKVAMVIS